jgi:hypothetical protein
MQSRSFTIFWIFASVLSWSAAVPAEAQPAQQSWSLVDKELGRSGATQPDGVRRYSFPRSDLKVTLDGIQLKPAFALGSWVAFQPTGSDAVIMGDLVLTDSEVNPVMTELLRGGIAVTALHNHLLRSSPQTLYMHVDGRGDAVKLAATLHAALSRSATPMRAAAPAANAPLDLDTATLDRIIGRQGKASGGIYQFNVPRPEKITESGMAVPATMGTSTAINFQPIGNGRAAVTGDFVLRASEVDPVIRSLLGGGIEVAALHSHMLNEEPRLFFMHFWGHGDAQRLATGLRAAIDKIGVHQSSSERGR